MKHLDDTDTATLTVVEAEQVVDQDREYNEALASLERLVGTYECYGAFSSGKPKLSKGVLCVQESA